MGKLGNGRSSSGGALGGNAVNHKQQIASGGQIVINTAGDFFRLMSAKFALGANKGKSAELTVELYSNGGLVESIPVYAGFNIDATFDRVIVKNPSSNVVAVDVYLYAGILNVGFDLLQVAAGDVLSVVTKNEFTAFYGQNLTVTNVSAAVYSIPDGSRYGNLTFKNNDAVGVIALSCSGPVSIAGGYTLKPGQELSLGDFYRETGTGQQSIFMIGDIASNANVKVMYCV